MSQLPNLFSLGPRVDNRKDAFECMRCDYEWRSVERAPVCCPRCGGGYYDWLSYDVATADVYFRREWESGKRVWKGTVVVRRD